MIFAFTSLRPGQLQIFCSYFFPSNFKKVSKLNLNTSRCFILFSNFVRDVLLFCSVNKSAVERAAVKIVAGWTNVRGKNYFTFYFVYSALSQIHLYSQDNPLQYRISLLACFLYKRLSHLLIFYYHHKTKEIVTGGWLSLPFTAIQHFFIPENLQFARNFLFATLYNQSSLSYY